LHYANEVSESYVESNVDILDIFSQKKYSLHILISNYLVIVILNILFKEKSVLTLRRNFIKVLVGFCIVHNVSSQFTSFLARKRFRC